MARVLRVKIGRKGRNNIFFKVLFLILNGGKNVKVSRFFLKQGNRTKQLIAYLFRL